MVGRRGVVVMETEGGISEIGTTKRIAAIAEPRPTSTVLVILLLALLQ
jgi:hypothetical protein